MGGLSHQVLKRSQTAIQKYLRLCLIKVFGLCATKHSGQIGRHLLIFRRASSHRLVGISVEPPDSLRYRINVNLFIVSKRVGNVNRGKAADERLEIIKRPPPKTCAYRSSTPLALRLGSA